MVAHLLDAFPGSLPGPGGIEQQDRRLMLAILDYRNLRTAVELMNAESAGYDALAKRPELSGLLLRVLRAQNDDAEIGADVARALFPAAVRPDA